MMGTRDLHCIRRVMSGTCLIGFIVRYGGPGCPNLLADGLARRSLPGFGFFVRRRLGSEVRVLNFFIYVVTSEGYAGAVCRLSKFPWDEACLQC